MKTASEMVIIKVNIYPLSMTLFWCLYCSLWTDSHLVLVMLTLLTLSKKMPAECGNDNDDGNSHDEDVDTTDFITAWKIYFYFFKIGAEGRRIRAEGCGSRKTKSRNWRKIPRHKQTLLYNRCNKEKHFTFVSRKTIINRIISIANR